MSQPLRRIILTHTKSRICSVTLSETMTVVLNGVNYDGLAQLPK